ncbi:hypothetical protein DES49_0354 [Halospina denitrificans]|uniref:Uncharacterized protein n=1 Tax=Halospina denitrificans TaxID=332522 RepID=A0A4R7K1M3_9GAMM|nr:HEPN domain-containing protein [Halospina denitrificans]TDT44254.1 hypothetical protein DES49_0354 [Halospina denitrificans]
MPDDFEVLKARHRTIREQLPDSLDLRVHRALSWLNRSEQCADDDGRFVFLWIAFNAVYAQEMRAETPMPEQRVLRDFLEKLVQLDRDGQLSAVVWTEFPNAIRLLLNNQYVFQPYWDCQNGVRPRGEWHGLFERAKVTASRALGSNDTTRVLGEVFSRLYTLRNQIMHGGSTWNSSINREQVRDGANILGQLVPVIIAILMAHPEADWGDPCYPVVAN